MVKVSTPRAPSSTVRWVSVMLAVGEGLAGLVRSIIWTASSVEAVTAA